MDDFSKQKIIKDIDQIKRSMASVDKTLALQHLSLQEHIRRTALLEEKFEPVEKHVEQVRGGIKFVGWLIAVLGVVAAFLALR